MTNTIAETRQLLREAKARIIYLSAQLTRANQQMHNQKQTLLEENKRLKILKNGAASLLDDVLKENKALLEEQEIMDNTLCDLTDERNELSEENESLMAAEACLQYDNEQLLERQKLLEKAITLITSRSHFCGGRDCTGFIPPDAASLRQCEMCRDMAKVLAALKEQT